MLKSLSLLGVVFIYNATTVYDPFLQVVGVFAGAIVFGFGFAGLKE